VFEMVGTARSARLCPPYELPIQTVIASEAKQSIWAARRKLDCFASLAMTTKYSFAFSRRDASEVSINLRPLTSEGVRDAGCTMHPQMG
jgi:hypothetical protein